MKKRGKSFEDSLSELQEIASVIDEGEPPLSEAIKLYKRGVELAAALNEQLSQVEGEVLVLRQQWGGKTLEPWIENGKAENCE